MISYIRIWVIVAVYIPEDREEGTPPPPPLTSEHFEGQESRKFHIQTQFLKYGGEAFLEGLILCTWMEERTYPLLINMMPKNEDIYFCQSF